MTQCLRERKAKALGVEWAHPRPQGSWSYHPSQKGQARVEWLEDLRAQHFWYSLVPPAFVLSALCPLLGDSGRMLEGALGVGGVHVKHCPASLPVGAKQQF